LFSQELGWSPNEFHKDGTALWLEKGSTTGMTPKAFKNVLSFLDDDASEKVKGTIKTPLDKPRADILLVHNAGEFLSWPDNHQGYAILFNAAGIDWTLSSEWYDATNYGLFYDDIQFARTSLKAIQAANVLKPKMVAVGECGHAHKALISTSDRLFLGDLAIPRVSVLNLLERIVFSGKVEFDPKKNSFPVTLHDPCNIVRNLGIYKPQRRILRYLCPGFREMSPSGMCNFCCGGGGGLALLSSWGFKDWRTRVSGEMKLKQILNAFKDCLDTKTRKYVCAPCSNCKRQLTDLFDRFGITEKYGIVCGGIGELVANTMSSVMKHLVFQEV
jgi:Fe-S oxidoreductase